MTTSYIKLRTAFSQKNMWAALPLQPRKPWLPNAISINKPRPRCHSMAVHNRQNAKDTGGSGKADINTLKSDEPLYQNAVESKIKTKPPPTPAASAAEKEAETEEKQELEEEQQQQRQLSGADVLVALQRAEKDKEKREAAGTVPRSRDNEVRENQGSLCFSDVRPLCIKPEWIGRLEQLERRLDQLAHR